MLDLSNFLSESGLWYFLSICLLLVYFVSAAGCHSFDLGALISSRLASAVERTLSSFTALFWFKGVDKEFKQFVENRVAGIRRKTDASSWNHIARKDNPSDLSTRGLQLSELLESDYWWH